TLERVPLAVPGHQGPGHPAAGCFPGQLHLQRGRHGVQPVRRHPCRCLRPGGTRRRTFHLLPAPVHFHQHRFQREGLIHDFPAHFTTAFCPVHPHPCRGHHDPRTRQRLRSGGRPEPC